MDFKRNAYQYVTHTGCGNELAPAGRIDLLSVIMHEMGQALGLADDYSESSRDCLMHGRLPPGGSSAGGDQA